MWCYVAQEIITDRENTWSQWSCGSRFTIKQIIRNEPSRRSLRAGGRRSGGRLGEAYGSLSIVCGIDWNRTAQLESGKAVACTRSLLGVPVDFVFRESYKCSGKCM